jgi:hypothetical protein
MQGTPLVNGAVDVPAFDEETLIKALRVDCRNLPAVSALLLCRPDGSADRVRACLPSR